MVHRVLAYISALLLLLPPAARAADPTSRVTEAPVDARPVPVRGSLSPQAAGPAAGAADPATLLRGASMLFSRSPAQQAELEELLGEQQDPSSARYHRWLTADEFAARFGLSPADVGAVASWLRSQGFTVEGQSSTRVSFTGTFAQIESAFHTRMRRYLRDGREHFANSTELSVPASLAGVVSGFRNLDDFRPRPRTTARKVAPEFTSSISGNHFLAPEDFATIYDVKGLYAAGLDGAGESIAVVGQTAIAQSDIDAFRAASGLSPSTVRMVLVPGSGSSVVSPPDVEEADLDTEWSGAVARNAQVVFVYTGSNGAYNVWDSLQYAVDQNLAPVVSISYGACEAEYGTSNAQALRQLVQRAAAQGQTVVAASGDAGPADCEASSATVATHGLAVDVPASVPEVTAVGGTQFAGDLTAPATYWSAANTAGGGSALSYIPEAVWNETAGGGGLAASGGGASAVFAKPSWQVGAGVPADGRRDVPDVALAAAAGHDGTLICSQGSCVKGFRDANQYLTVVGGTSVAAPCFAGIVAILNQATGSAQGNVNPVLYPLAASTAAAFHPITQGDSFVPCQAGSPGCPAAPPLELGFAATAGYDQATGLGSVVASTLAFAWPGYKPRAATSTAIASSVATPVLGSPVVLTGTVSSASGAPTGTVQFADGARSLGSPAALAGGTAVLTTSALAVGAHALSATYSGDSSHLSSTAPAVAVTVTDYSIATSPPTLSLPRGGKSAAAVTVGSVGPFSGTVLLSCVAPAGIQCSLAPSSVTLDPSGPTGTSTLTVSAAPATSTSRPPRGGSRLALAALLLAAAGAVISSPRRRSLPALLAAAALSTGAAACGLSPSSGAGATVTVSAAIASGGVSHSVSLPVNVE
ncbi:MAG TPA: protease pro-enzyme activation domain-containing protein [Anaeromyxobacteraceae bacterium]|nr:protease pro-enzyme activation domain-containing protein [Anaeromyxobacteraceae bacterium]